MSRSLATAALLVLLACGTPALAESEALLLRRLGDPAQRVREQALRRLRMSPDLTAEMVSEALSDASPAALPTLLELAGTRGFKAAAPRVAALVAAPDPVDAEAALRCLVLLGPESVALGLAELPPDDPVLGARRLRLRALATQDAVEQDLLSRWRRKGGTYEGRFSALTRHGWAVQPVLMAMLLDIPMEDRFLDLPEDREPSLTRRYVCLREVLRSERRGYRTFRPLPLQIDGDDLFELASQALMDVGDIEVLENVLDGLAEMLEAADRRYQMTIGFQLRPWERMYADAIGEILAAHDRKERLARRAEELEQDAASALLFAQRRPRGEERAEYMQWYSTELGRLAGVLHRMREFDRAAEVYAKKIRVEESLAGQPSAISTYNRACALARAGRPEEALEQLDVSLGTDLTDLTREWVEEDGDLHSLREDPRFDAILDRHFGPSK